MSIKHLVRFPAATFIWFFTYFLRIFSVNRLRQFWSNFSVKVFFTQMTSSVLIFSILAVSTPAAPLMLTSSLNQFGRDVRLAYLTSPNLAYLSEIDLTDNFIFAFFFKGGKKLQTATKIEISPNRAVIREGQSLPLTAVALDSRGNVIQGVSFNWTARNLRKEVPPIKLPNGIFTPQYGGIFEITAEGGGQRGVTKIRVVQDSYSMALLERDKQQREQAGERRNSNKPRQIRQDVGKVLNEKQVASFNYSSRMSRAEANQLNQSDKTFRQQNPNKPLVDPNTNFPQIKKAPPAKQVDPSQTGTVDSGETVETEGGIKKGGPSLAEESNPKDSNLFYPPLSGSLDTITGPNITGCGYDGYGWSGATIDLYIDGGVYTGTYIGSAIAFSGCNFSEPIPSTYLDGQLHNVYAYIYDYDTYQYFELDNSPQPFQIGSGGGGGGGGTDSNWNNNNAPTADDPGVQPGDPANNGTDGAGSSNFSFSAPVLSLGGRGMSVNLALSYNSLLWHNDGTNINYDIDKGFPAPGWNIGFGKMMDMGTTGGAMMEDLDGTRHSYQGTTTTYGSYSTYYGKTTDGSFIDYTANRGPSGLYSATAHLANGTIISYNAAANGVLYPTYIIDRHGNYLKIAYQNNQGPRITTITDNLNRAITFNYDGSNRLISVTGPGFNGTTRTFVQLHYTQQTLSYGFTGLTPQVRDANPYQIDSIYYPGTNTGYWFGDGNSYSSYGMIAKVSERRGMTCSGCTTTNQGTITAGTMTREMSYNYPLTAGSLSSAPQYTQMTEDWAGREGAADGHPGTPTAITQYSIVNNPPTGQPRTTTITLPNGNRIIQYSKNNPNVWDDGLLYKIETLPPVGNNTPLSKSETDWQVGDYSSARVTEIRSTDEKQQTTKQVFTYDTNAHNYNQVATISEFGYSNNLLRKSVNTYENGAAYQGSYTTINGQSVWSYGRHIFSLVKTQELFADDAQTVRLSKTDYSYDTETLMDAPGVVMYDQTYNPYTTETTQGACLAWEEWAPYWWECVEYEQIPNFNSDTLARGNVTSVKTYPDAANPTPASALNYVSTYDITGNTRTTTTDCCELMQFEYTATTKYSQPEIHKKGSPITPALQNIESAAYDPNTGLMTSSIDFNGVQTNYLYDSVNRPLEVISATNSKSVTVYDDANLAVTQTALKYNSPGNYDIISQGQSFANGRGQTIKSKSLAGASWNEAVVKYDFMGRQKYASLPYQTGGSPTNWTTYNYDLLSRVTQVIAPDGSTSNTFYNEPNNKPSSASTDVGNTVRSQDAWGRERWARTDDWGRLKEVVEPDPNGNGSVTAAGNMVTTYNYSPKDELVQVLQGDQERKFAYDSLGRLVRQKLAEQALTIEGQWSDAFVYDNRSNLVQRTDARGVKTNFVYNSDPLNRLQSINYDKTQAPNSSLIADVPTVTIGYKTGGDKTRVETVTTTGVSTETNVYDSLGRVTLYNLAMFGKSDLTTEYEYDSANRLTKVKYPNQYGTSNPGFRKEVNPTYDNASRLVTLDVSGTLQLSGIVYNPLSQVTELITGASTSNADVEQYGYDAQTGLLTSQIVKKQNNNLELLNLSYNYQRRDGNGNLIAGKTGQLTNIVNNLDQNKNRIYEFDTLGRLVNAKGGAAAGGVQIDGNHPAVTANWTQTYSYDRYGNRTNVAKTGVTANTNPVPLDGLGAMSYDSSSNRITNTDYLYDAAGNLLKGQAPDGSWQWYEYDAAGRLVKIRQNNDQGAEIESYAYGASRQRLRTISGSLTTYYAWGGSSVLCEYTETTGNGATFAFKKSYIYAGSRLLSTQVWNGSGETTEFHHPDRLGTKLVTNNTANTFYEQSTLPFGTSLDAEFIGTPTTNQRFTSYDRSEVASLDYAVNRSYSSGQGRFTSVDPIGMSSTNLASPQSLNLYSYVRNNPIDFKDPSGLDGILDQGIAEARNLLKGSLCRSLFGNVNPDELLDRFLEKEGKLAATPIIDFQINPDGSLKHAQTGEGNPIREPGGFYDPRVDIIVINAAGAFYTLNINFRGGGGTPYNTVSTYGDITPNQFRAVILIHELIHAAGDRKHAGMSNNKFTEKVRLFCVTLNPAAKQTEVTTETPKLGDTFTPRPLEPLPGGGGGGGGNYDPFRSIQWLLFERWARDGWGEPKILDDRDGWGEPKILD